MWCNLIFKYLKKQEKEYCEKPTTKTTTISERCCVRNRTQENNQGVANKVNEENIQSYHFFSSFTILLQHDIQVISYSNIALFTGYKIMFGLRLPSSRNKQVAVQLNARKKAIFHKLMTLEFLLVCQYYYC